MHGWAKARFLKVAKNRMKAAGWMWWWLIKLGWNNLWSHTFYVIIIIPAILHNFSHENQRLADSKLSSSSVLFWFYTALASTVNVLGQYVLSDPYIVVHLFSKHAARCSPVQYHYVRDTKSLLGCRSAVSKMFCQKVLDL